MLRNLDNQLKNEYLVDNKKEKDRTRLCVNILTKWHIFKFDNLS